MEASVKGISFLVAENMGDDGDEHCAQALAHRINEKVCVFFVAGVVVWPGIQRKNTKMGSPSFRDTPRRFHEPVATSHANMTQGTGQIMADDQPLLGSMNATSFWFLDSP